MTSSATDARSTPTAMPHVQFYMDQVHPVFPTTTPTTHTLGKVCFNEETLSIHINKEHRDRQHIFPCAFCGIRTNKFSLYARHLEQHKKDMFQCHACGKKYDSAKRLKTHMATHANQCPLCSRSFGNLQEVSKHVNTAHGAALAEDRKKCLYCDTAFDTVDQLGKHSKNAHRYYFCNVCFTGFVSEPLLVEHHVNDHQTGCPGEQCECLPKEEGEPNIAVIKIVDPEVEEAMKVIRTPDPDPFADKWHPAHGQVKCDNTYKFQCRECHRYLKNVKVWVEHIKQFHPTVSYVCKFCPDLIFYAIQDLEKHCKRHHCVCSLCNSGHVDQVSLQIHMRECHSKKPAAAPTASATSSATPTTTTTDPPAGATVPSADVSGTTNPDTSTASTANVRPVEQGFTCESCKVFCPTRTSYKIHVTTHKKVMCPHFPQKFFNEGECDVHILERHKNKLKGKISCRLAPDCEAKFSSVKEVRIHCRRHHQANFPWRCSVKDCYECFPSITDLFCHAERCHDHKVYSENRRFTCSICKKLFDTLDELMIHTGVHPNNRFGCDECSGNSLPFKV